MKELELKDLELNVYSIRFEGWACVGAETPEVAADLLRELLATTALTVMLGEPSEVRCIGSSKVGYTDPETGEQWEALLEEWMET